ncbi:MAG: glycosyltransferase family 4 protein [Anaerolineales bacterium]|jgi:glycosyltransferase involved in cell wall biosynthesis|nr:glycosyltransferase family 4 protein [Anaerolineales bacterium]MDL1925244.1 glycosyltransferase family 4 protein [Anaerolineae bacterium AMX1]MDX9937507.1 glycosyltransferase family 4 protein [Anaerolineales bacterium]GER78958.1 glycosyltransferase family 4 protein [Candidatus Denitrolinea symbiosum]
MRILVVIHEYPPIGGGGGAAARDICRGLARRGHDVKILTAHYKGLPRRERDEGVDVIRLPSLRRQPFRAGFLEMGGFVLASLWAGLRLTRVFRPDAIHAHFAVPSGAAAWALARLTRTPYLLTAHLGDVPGGVPDKTDRWFRWVMPFTRPIWREAARVAAVSGYTRGLALAHYPVPIDVIPNGVDVKSLAPRVLKVNDPPRLVFAGRFVEQKNPLQIPRVLAALKDLRWECSMLGDGVLLEATRAETERLGLADRFRFPGWVETGDVLDEFARSDVLFMPSRSEGLPVVGVQALACGLALVVGRAGGFADLAAPGENGFLHDADDAEGFSASLRSLLSDPVAILSARQKSLAFAQSFDIEHVIDEYEKVLLAIIDS